MTAKPETAAEVLAEMPRDIELAIAYSRNFATAKPDIGATEKEHILGLCALLERALSAQGEALDAVMRARGLPAVKDALGYSRNFAAANPHLTTTAAEHITGLCDMLEIAAAQSAPAPEAQAVASPLDLSAPPKVWLQVDPNGDADERSQAMSRAVWDDLSWHYENIGGLEIEYVRADLAHPAPAAKPITRENEASLMLAIAEFIAASATPEDPRLGVAYAISRHLGLGWPCASHHAPARVTGATTLAACKAYNSAAKKAGSAPCEYPFMRAALAGAQQAAKDGAE